MPAAREAPAAQAVQLALGEAGRARSRLRGAGSRLGAVTVVGLVAVGGLVMAGCAGQEQAGTSAQQVSTWVSGAGAGAAIGTINVDSKNIELAFSRHDPTDALRTVCLLLANDAQVGIGNLPSPNQQLTDDLNTAYTTAYNAGMDCDRGANSSSSLVKRSVAERAKAASQLMIAYNEITSLVGQPPSTTTTTAPIGSSMDPFGN